MLDFPSQTTFQFSIMCTFIKKIFLKSKSKSSHIILLLIVLPQFHITWRITWHSICQRHRKIFINFHDLGHYLPAWFNFLHAPIYTASPSARKSLASLHTCHIFLVIPMPVLPLSCCPKCFRQQKLSLINSSLHLKIILKVIHLLTAFLILTFFYSCNKMQSDKMNIGSPHSIVIICFSLIRL